MTAIKETIELRRILALPRREAMDVEDLADRLTELLKTPHGTQRLFPLQALALHDIAVYGGAFLPLDVGEGKTLISLMAPYVLDAFNVLLMLPAHLIRKTADERAELAKHWLIPNNIRFFSYQMLGLVQAEHELEAFKPDLIIFDESQKVKNRDVAVTRRIERYMDRHPTTRVVAMTGTIMRTSIKDFAHTLRWCLKDNAPVPLNDGELDEWALALDEKVANEFCRLEPGALLQMCSTEDLAAVAAGEISEIVAARRGFSRRLRETPGIVASAETGTKVDIPLRISALEYDLSETTEAHFDRLRNEMVTPDDWNLSEAIEVWQHARQLALGFHQIWDPRPPDDWRKARRGWFAFVRAVLEHSRTYDSPEHVARACLAGRLPSHALDRWRAIEHTFEIHTKAIWHDDGPINVAAQWMAQGPGIVWTEHVEFAQRLARVTGQKYFGAKGLSYDGEFVDHADPKRPAIVSVDANREGRNLQKKWSRNLVVSPEEGADKWQQLIGRTHRTGQTAPIVTVDVFLGCAEHARAFARARAGAKSIRDTVGAQSKLLIADVDWPSREDIAARSSPRWIK